MFKWPFRRNAAAAKKERPNAADFKRFEEAYQMLSARAAELTKEYYRTRESAAITKILEAYKDPGYVVEGCNAIFATVEDPKYRSAHHVLPLVATMFMTMASDALGSSSSISSFSSWANSFSDVQKRELVRLAYITTAWEQQDSGPTSPVSFATRILLMTLAANANDDRTSKDAAQRLFAYIDRLRDSLSTP